MTGELGERAEVLGALALALGESDHELAEHATAEAGGEDAPLPGGKPR